MPASRGEMNLNMARSVQRKLSIAKSARPL